MDIDGSPSRSLWIERLGPHTAWVGLIDQRDLPHRLTRAQLHTLEDAVRAIADMAVRGAPLIGVTAACGMALQAQQDPGDGALAQARAMLDAARPTAVNLAWATRRVHQALLAEPPSQRAGAAWALAAQMADEDVAVNQGIARHGLALIEAAARRHPQRPVRVLTHCNAGWLATVDWGTALAPLYLAHRQGLALQVWVDETRPRNQGASLTAWELGQQGVPHTVIADNLGGHLMQHGEVDLVIVGADRVTRRGDVCNKIGTYLKALAAHDNGVPFYVAMPLSTLDLALADGLAEIPIEARDPAELTHVTGQADDGQLVRVRLTPAGSPALNLGFDVTPARLVSGLITEHGVVPADEAALIALAAQAGHVPGGA